MIEEKTNELTKSVVPIVMSTDDNYAPILGVSLYSILANANESFFYDIYILHHGLSEVYQERILECARKTAGEEMAAITFKDISDYIDLQEHYSVHLSIATVYRLFIPEILNQYDKALYIDSDSVTIGDISELFAYDIGNNLIGAIKEIPTSYGMYRYEKEVGVNPKDAFNAGILVMNLKECRKADIGKKGMLFLQEDWKRKTPKYPYMDNDVLNVMCEGRTAFLPLEWNFLWWGIMNETARDLPNDVVERILKAKNGVKLIHYASAKKPWTNPELELADAFWIYARRTCFYEEILLSKRREMKSDKKFSPIIFAKTVAKRLLRKTK